MVGIKELEKPSNCWDCDLTYDDYCGCARCCLTKEALFPMKETPKVLENCPLVEIEENN